MDIQIWGVPYMEIPKHGEFKRKNPTKMDDLGVPYFRKPPYFSKNKGTHRNIQSVSSNQMNRPSQGRSNVSALVSGL